MKQNKANSKEPERWQPFPSSEQDIKHLIKSFSNQNIFKQEQQNDCAVYHTWNSLKYKSVTILILRVLR